jgi:hypothetical protein
VLEKAFAVTGGLLFLIAAGLIGLSVLDALGDRYERLLKQYRDRNKPKEKDGEKGDLS